METGMSHILDLNVWEPVKQDEIITVNNSGSAAAGRKYAGMEVKIYVRKIQQ